MAKNGYFISTIMPFVWHTGCQEPPELIGDYEIDYQMFLFVDMLGIVSGFYDFEEKQFYKHCERYDDTDDERPAHVSYVDNINNNLEWVHEPVDKVVYWMLVPAPILPAVGTKPQPDYRLN